MDYTEDPFEPGDHIFIYYIYHGMALFCVGAQGNTAYYIPDDEPDVMYQYAATEKSGNVVKRSEYTMSTPAVTESLRPLMKRLFQGSE